MQLSERFIDSGVIGTLQLADQPYEMVVLQLLQLTLTRHATTATASAAASVSGAVAGVRR